MQVQSVGAKALRSWAHPKIGGLLRDGMKILLMIEILHYLKDPKLWELWYSLYYLW